MLTITHTHADGTLIEGTAKGDGTAPILKTCGWRWGRSIGAWYVPYSRDRRPKQNIIEATAAQLESAGYEVVRRIDQSVRSTAEVEAAKIERQDARVVALAAKADRKNTDAEAAWNRHMQDVARLPEGGEPIKVGHHSESRHRNALTRADNSARRGIQAYDEAERAAERAAAATHTTGARYNPVTVANRIEKIGADIRRLERRIGGDVYDPETGYRPATDTEKQSRSERLTPALDELRDKLTYWEAVRAKQIATGQANNHSRATIKKGDRVKIRGQWREVVRANAKTVSVTTGYSWTDTAPYAEIQQHERPK